MNKRSLHKIWKHNAALLIVALLIKLFSLFPLQVEKLYSTKIYPSIAAFLRIIFGWIPFSVGDILYAAVAIWIITKVVKMIIAVLKKRVTKLSFFYGVSRVVKIILFLYIIFNFLWGLNYDRSGISYQLQLKPVAYSTEELKSLTDSLIAKVNTSRLLLSDKEVYAPLNSHVYETAAEAYHQAEGSYSFLSYHHKSIKPSLYGEFGNYLGFLGYYNPFTGEANLNTTVPSFIVPYVTCHEIGHQLGYATEDEASFAGFLAVKSLHNKLFDYSMYFDLFSYANSELFVRDSVAARNNFHLLDTSVRKDQKLYRQFLLSHKNPIEPWITKFYSAYLKANNQPQGIETYTEITAWLVAYQKKYRNL